MPRVVPALDLRFPAEPDVPDLVSVALHDIGPTAVHEIGPDESAPVWRVFFATPQARDAALARLAKELGTRGLIVSATSVPDEDWAARSQASLGHVRVGRVVVAPPWDVPALSGPDDVLVVIRPSMGFGTGHHESTRLCLGMLQQLDCPNRRVIDVGTGSGVLAIAAASLGARDVEAFDLDPDAIESARENVELNSRRDPAIANRITLSIGDLRDARPPAGIVLANLTGGALIGSAPALAGIVSPGGRLVISGFQAHESDAVLHAFAAAARCERLEAEEGWRAAQLQLTPGEEEHG